MLNESQGLWRNTKSQERRPWADLKKIKKDGKLISAQPLIKEGRMVSGSKGHFKEDDFDESKEIIVGYYHVFANNIDNAISIAKQNPEFEYSTTARVEVRPIKVKEDQTGYVHPSA